MKILKYILIGVIAFLWKDSSSQISKKDSLYLLEIIDESQDLRDKNELAKSLESSIIAIDLSKGNPYLRYRSHACMAQNLWILGAKKDAIEHLYKAISANTKFESKYNLFNAITYGTIGSFHLNIKQYDSSVTSFKRAIGVLKKINNPLFLSSAYNNLGLSYTSINKFDSAINVYNRAINTLDLNINGHKRFLAVILENMADIEIKTGNYNKAIDFLSQSIELMAKNGDENKWNKLGNYYTLLIETKHKIKDYAGINNLIDTFYQYYLNNSNTLNAYKQAIRVSKVQIDVGYGNRTALLIERDVLWDSLTHALNFKNTKVLEGLTKYKQSILEQQKTINELRQIENQNSLQLAKANTRRYKLIALVVLILAMGSIWIIWINQKRKKAKAQFEHKMAELELENQRLIEKELAMELKRKKNDLLQLALDNSKKLDWNNELIARLRNARKESPKNLDKTLRELELQMAQQLQTDNRAAILHAKVDEINQEFVNNLTLKFPNLTRTDIELCGFLKLQLSGQDIALIRNVEPKSITKAKQRLKKKLDIASDTDIYSFIRNLGI